MSPPHDDARPTASGGVPPDVGPDGHLGAYRLIRELGHGGMGAVYLGVRDDDAFQKRVAIKVLERGMDPRASSAASATSGRSWRASRTKAGSAEADHSYIDLAGAGLEKVRSARAGRPR